MAHGRVKIRKIIEWEELERLIRNVPMLGTGPGGEVVLPYVAASISLRTVSPEELCASTKYLIKRNLERQRSLHTFLLKEGYDIFHLNCAIEIENESGEVWRIMPPVVEVVRQEVRYVPREGELDYGMKSSTIPLHIVIDGMHRMYLARELGKDVTVVFARGISDQIPYYTLPNDWNDIVIYTDTPQTKEQKKMYRREDCYSLFRNFDVLGCGKPRHVGTGGVAE